MGSLNQQQITRTGCYTYHFHLQGHTAGQVNDTLRPQMKKQPVSGCFFFIFRGQVSHEKWRNLIHVWLGHERDPLIIIHPGTITEIQYKPNNNHGKHVVKPFLLAQAPLVFGSLLSHWAEIKSLGDASDADMRQRDCLLPTTGWMREKCQECRESIGFFWRKETRAFRLQYVFT